MFISGGNLVIWIYWPARTWSTLYSIFFEWINHIDHHVSDVSVTFSDQSTAIPGASGEASEKQDWSIMGEFDQDWTKAAEAQGLARRGFAMEADEIFTSGFTVSADKKSQFMHRVWSNSTRGWSCKELEQLETENHVSWERTGRSFFLWCKCDFSSLGRLPQADAPAPSTPTKKMLLDLSPQSVEKFPEALHKARGSVMWKCHGLQLRPFKDDPPQKKAWSAVVVGE